MPGYCGKCQTHYRESGFEHDEECEGVEKIEQGSEKEFERLRQENDWDDDEAHEIWDKHYRD